MQIEDFLIYLKGL